MIPLLEKSAPPQLRRSDGWAFGRYREPIDDPSLAPLTPWRRLRVKEWHYHSVVSEEWFLALAVAQLGYVANAFVYLVERAAPERRREHEALSPLGRALDFAPSSVHGTTRWSSKGAQLSIAHCDGWRLELDVVLAGERLRGQLEIAPRESLAVVFPLADDRPAYTHKAAGLPVEGALTLSGRNLDFSGSMATLDWTRSLANRHTHWKWASFAGCDRTGRTLGLNLSAEVYDQPPGESHENALFIDGITHSLGGVRFEVPQRPERERWRIESRSTAEVELEFRPLGARRQRLELGILRSNFVQAYGTFHGTVTPAGLASAEVDGVFGVVENHDALW